MTPEDLARSQSAATAMESAKCFLACLNCVGKPKAMVDIGCGNGHLVQLAACLGIVAVGVDIGLPLGPRPGFLRHTLWGADLQYAWNGATGDLTLCWEVAEHLEEKHADTLCKTLHNVTEPGGTLLFSAAVPGQGGAGHVNEQPVEYWQKKLEAIGFVHQDSVTRMTRFICSEVSRSAWWYGKNMMGFKR